MKQHEQEFSLEKMAAVLGVSRSGYYRFRKAQSSTQEQKDQQLVKKSALFINKATKLMVAHAFMLS